MSHVYLNNRLLPAAQASVSVFDRGFAYGDSLFETLKMIAGRPVFFQEHMDRLAGGMKTAGFKDKLDHEALRQQALELAARNGVELGRLRILVTRGTPAEPQGPDPGKGLTATVLVSVETFAGMAEDQYAKGVPVRTLHTNRGRYAHVKSASLLDSILARREVHHAGAWEGVLTSGHGRLLEGAYSNIFFLAGKLLLTAPDTDRILPGVIRQKVIAMAPDLGLEVQFLALTLEEISLAEAAVFLTSSLMGICRVSELNDRKLPPDPGVIALLRQQLNVLEIESSKERS